MNKNILAGIGIIIVVIGIWYSLTNESGSEESSPKNSTYLIEETPYKLSNGVAEQDILPDSASKMKVSLFGEPSYGDIDNDGDEDAVVVLVSDGGGSGTFYYAGMAVNKDGVYIGTDTIFMGDRVAPQNHSIRDGRAIINYADRNPGESFDVRPSVGKTLMVKPDENMRLGIIANNFEGEANPDTMTLEMKEWRWIRTTYNNDTEVLPKSNVFRVSFEDGRFSAITDCNSLSGEYSLEDNKITFGNMASTKKYCLDSQESEFTSMIQEVQSYLFTSRGELVLELKYDTGSMIFR